MRRRRRRRTTTTKRGTRRIGRRGTRRGRMGRGKGRERCRARGTVMSHARVYAIWSAGVILANVPRTP